MYPVPWGGYVPGDNIYSANTPGTASAFPVHATVVGTSLDRPEETLGKGDVIIRARINDPDFDVCEFCEDRIAQNTAADVGPLKITVSRGADKVTLGYAGGTTATDGKLDVGDDGIDGDFTAVRQLGPITEIAGDAGIFELDLAIAYTDGPSSSACPVSDRAGGDDANGRMDLLAPAGENYCILQGDILTVEYTDPADASGGPNTVTDSATFDLRNGVLQSDKNVYFIGHDMILTIIEPDWNLDGDDAETYSLNAVEWDSAAGTLGLDQGVFSGNTQISAFDPEPGGFRETGDNTGVFQMVLEIPNILYGNSLERGEEIKLEYTDWGPSGANYVGETAKNVNLKVFTSNFGAAIELDQKAYSWTDKVFITVVAPDYNFDSQLIDEIGQTSRDAIRVFTRSDAIDRYKLVETGTDTGIFTGEVILTGFPYDADGNDGTGNNGFDTNPRTSPDGSGPTDGFLRATENDFVSVYFELSGGETAVGSSIIWWNLGIMEWLEPSYPASGTGVVRVVDPDMNLNPEAFDTLDIGVWSDSDPGGIDLTMTETNEATGIFEGTVFFTTTEESSGHMLRVAEGDTVFSRYYDYTLPAPAARDDREAVSSAFVIGDTAPPLERVPISNLRVVNLEPLQSGRMVQTGSGPAAVTTIPLIDHISRITFVPSGLYAIALDLSSLALVDPSTKSSLCALAGAECVYLGDAKTAGQVTVETGMDLVTRVILPGDMQIVGMPLGEQVYIYEAEQRRAQQALNDADFASDPRIGGYDVASAQVVELGSPSADLIFSSFVRVFFDPSVLYEGTLVFSVDSVGNSKILTRCGSDPAAALAALRPSATIDGLACVDYGSSSIWTRHFTAFGVAPPIPSEPTPALINRGGGGGGGGGGGSVSGAVGTGGAVPVYIQSVSWDCEAGTVKVEAGPDDDGLTVTVLSKTLGLSTATPQDGDATPKHRLFTAPMDSEDDFIQVKALSVGGRDFSSATESLNLNSCTGTRTFQTSTPAAAPNLSVQPDQPAPALVQAQTEERPTTTDLDTAQAQTEERPPTTPEPDTAQDEPERATPESTIQGSEQTTGDQMSPPTPECGDGTVLSPDGICEVAQDSSGCLIATAAHGTELAPQIQHLREIRDGKVLSTGSGAAFMGAFNKIYYSFSPAVADAERQNPALRHAAAAALAPMLATLHVMDFAKEGSEAHVAGLGALVIALNVAVYGSPAVLAAVFVRAGRARRAL